MGRNTAIGIGFLVLTAFLLFPPGPPFASSVSHGAAPGPPAGPGVGVQEEADLAAYWQIVDGYRAGNVLDAARRITSFGAPRTQRAFGELQRRVRREPEGGSWSVARLRAAVVMHTHLALMGLIESPTERADHLRSARRLVDLEGHGGQSEDRRALPRSFRKRWYLWVIWSAHQVSDLEAVAAYLDSLEPAFRDDADFLLSAGSFAETLAWPRLASIGSRPVSSRRRMNRGQLLDTAEDRYERALAALPDLSEARLRLARVLFDRGRAGDALETLTPLFALADTRLLYLARLFAGAACESLQRWREASAHYRMAVQVRPELATPRIALSHALRHLGDMAGAAAEAEEALRSGEGVDDPWWGYYFGQGFLAARLGYELIEEVAR